MQQHSGRRAADGGESQARSGRTSAELSSSLRIVLLAVGTAVIGLAAFRDSLAWQLQNWWGASRDFWQARWDEVVRALGDDPATYWIYGTTALTFALYWAVGGLYSLADLTGRLRRYKIQPEAAAAAASGGRLARVLGQVLLNQLAVGLPLAHLGFRLMRWRGLQPLRPLPSLPACLAHLAVHVLCEEVGFYYSHRLLHWRRLYGRIHKQHHQWTAPLAVTAIYCHPLEHLASNLLPPFLGPLLLGSHVAVAWLWFCLAILSTLNAHCGYHLPFLPSPEAHDFHHRRFDQCFGVLGVLDRLHGTDSLFRSSTAYRRHLVLMSLRPARQLVPDLERDHEPPPSAASPADFAPLLRTVSDSRPICQANL